MAVQVDHRDAVPASSNRSPLPPTPYDAFQERPRFLALDGLRAFSILAVLWHHTVEGLGVLPADHNGFLGVDMFFVLSGFLIVTLILREQRRTGRFSLQQFYVRRVLRIFPAYYLVLAIVLLLVTVVASDSAMRAAFLDELPFYLTYTSNWIEASTIMAIAWSLAAEEQFYLLWPPIEKFFARRIALIAAGALLLNQLLNFGVLDGLLEQGFGLQRDRYAILQVTFTPICLGVLLAHALADRRVFPRVQAILARPWAPWILLALLVAACNVPGSLIGLPRLSIHLAMTLFLAACVLAEDHVLPRLLAHPLLVRIGVISYGMYLYHQLARHGVESLQRALGLDSPLLLFVGCSLLTIAVAEASFRLFEAPFTRLRRRFRSGERSAAVTPQPPRRAPRRLRTRRAGSG